MTRDKKLLVATFIAFAMGTLTLTIEDWQARVGDRISSISTVLLTPGLYAAALTGSLTPGALINGSVYFGLALLALRVWRRDADT
jgi:hypothetical protein